MTGLALILFIGLFAFGGEIFSWSDPSGQVQFALLMSFVFGTICGHRTRG